MLYDAVINVVEENFAPTSVDRRALDEAAVRAALASLNDPYSELIPQRAAAKESLVLSIAGRDAPRNNVGLTVVKDSRIPKKWDLRRLYTLAAVMCAVRDR